MTDGIFRAKKSFTIVQNELVRDNRMSLKAKGLYLLIQSYITLPNKKWKKSEFMAMTKEKEKAFESAWNELKGCGYLKMHITREDKGWKVEYDLLDEADMGAHTFYYNSKGELTKTNLSKKEHSENNQDHILDVNDENPFDSVDEKSNGKEPENAVNTSILVEEDHGDQNDISWYPQNGGITKKDPPPWYPHFGGILKGGIKKHKYYNDNTINIYKSINQSKYYIADQIDGFNSHAKLNGDYEKLLKDNLDYDYHKKFDSFGSWELYEDMFNLILDTVNIKRDTIKINKTKYPYEVVKSKFLKLNSSHLEYVIESLKNTTTKVSNIKAYLLTALFNAPDTINAYYSQQVNHDMYGGNHE